MEEAEASSETSKSSNHLEKGIILFIWQEEGLESL